MQDQRHETDREQHEPGQTQRGRTHDEQQGHSAGADHSAIWQQLSNAHWRGIIWRRPHPAWRRGLASVFPASYLGGKSDEGPNLRVLCCGRALRHLAAHRRRPRSTRSRCSRTRRCPTSCASARPPRRRSGSCSRPPQGTTLQTITLPAADNVGDTGCPGLGEHLRARRGCPRGRHAAGLRPLPRRRARDRDAGRHERDVRAPLRRLLRRHDAACATCRTRRRSAAASSPRAAAGSLHGRRVDRRRRRHRDRHGAGQRLVGDPDPRDDHARAVPHLARLGHASHAVRRRSAREQRSCATLSAAGRRRSSDAPRCGRASAPTARRAAAARAPRFDAAAPSGGALAVAGQTGWFPGHNVTLPSGAFRLDGFDASVPTGYTGSYDYTLKFFDPESVSSLAAVEPAELHRARRRRDLSGRRAGEPARRLGRRPVHRAR